MRVHGPFLQDGLRLPGTASITHDPLSGIEQSSEGITGGSGEAAPMQPTHPAEGAGLVSACVATTDWAA